MDRVRVICQHVRAASQPLRARACAATSQEEIEETVQWIRSGKDAYEQKGRLMHTIMESGDRLLSEGKWPVLTLFDGGLVSGHDADVPSKEAACRMLAEAHKNGSLGALELLPGPWQGARTPEDRVALIREIMTAEAQGNVMSLYAKWMQQYGDQGLGSNIAVPHVSLSGTGSKMVDELVARVIIGAPEDAERLSRVHTRKEGNFCPVLYDSVIATDDNEHWQAQRRHLQEAFLPLSTLAEILPKSLERARSCAERLACAAEGGAPVDMNSFLLHEAQAQLQLALLGCPEAFMEATNAPIRATFQGEPDDAEVGSLTSAMQAIMERCRTDPSLALPTDERPVRGPLSRAVATSDLPESANFGNMLLILFAGHDTTGHTMTWLLFELARNPELQRELQREVDRFFEEQGDREPAYRDLSRLGFMDRCITETLRLWPAVANGTFRRLQFSEDVAGPGGRPVALPRGTAVQVVNWPRHRNPDLWGADANRFNPKRSFERREVAHVGCPLAAANPQSARFSPFAHSPRSCLGRNFAQMEMRLIMLYLLRRFSFELAGPYAHLVGTDSSVEPAAEEFRGVNGPTMGPMDLTSGKEYAWGTRHTTGLLMHARPRQTGSGSTF